MKRFLTSRSADEKADAADLLREKQIHRWRLTGDPIPIPRRSSFNGPLDHGRRLTLADVSAPGLQSTASPGVGETDVVQLQSSRNQHTGSRGSPDSFLQGAATSSSAYQEPVYQRCGGGMARPRGGRTGSQTPHLQQAQSPFATE